MSKCILYRILLLAGIICLLFASCAQEPDEEDHIDFSDPVYGSSLLTASDLIAFIKNGRSDTATLAASIDLNGQMISIPKERGPIIIEGNGFTLTSSADCVIRLHDGASVTLNDITVIGGADVIGCLGVAHIGGKNAKLQGIAYAVRSEGAVTILTGSELALTGTAGSAVSAKTLTLEQGAKLAATGGKSAVNVYKDDLTLHENAYLEATTQSDFNAVKCAGTLVMMDASSFIARNLGNYHGAEIEYLHIEGNVTIQADGGREGAGIFLFQLAEDYGVKGHCNPPLRKENGKGTITFSEG